APAALLFPDFSDSANRGRGRLTQVGDMGLAHFKDCKNLTHLSLREMQVSDKGLAHFSGCKNLTWLNLKQTKVTRAKIEELRKAFPKCKIEWDSGVIEPKAKEWPRTKPLS